MKIGHSIELTPAEIQDAIALRAIEAFETKHPGVKLDRVQLMRDGIKVFLLDKDGKQAEVAVAMITWSA